MSTLVQPSLFALHIFRRRHVIAMCFPIRSKWIGDFTVRSWSNPQSSSKGLKTDDFIVTEPSVTKISLWLKTCQVWFTGKFQVGFNCCLSVIRPEDREWNVVVICKVRRLTLNLVSVTCQSRWFYHSFSLLVNKSYSNRSKWNNTKCL